MTRARIGILMSGRGSNMGALIEAARDPACPFEVALVASDRPAAPGLAVAEAAGVRAIGLPTPTRKDKAQYEQALDRQLRAAEIEYLALAGYMRLLSPGFVEAWSGRMLNVHPSLLPAFPGLDTHQRALAAGVKLHGATVHLVTAELDAGPIVAQSAVAVLDDDSPETLAARVLAEEHRLYPAALAALVRGRLRVEGQRVLGFPPLA